MYLWTSEAVSSGHPDKVADQIADSILDAYLAKDPNSRVAAEVTILKDLVLLSGEITSQAEDINPEEIARARLNYIGYNSPERSFDARLCDVLTHINTQSPQISSAVHRADGDLGAGDQGLMFGYATDETENLMPLAHTLAFELINLHDNDVINGRIDLSEKKVRRLSSTRWDSLFYPDAKAQVTLAYNDDGTPDHVHTVVFSTCHKEGATQGDLYGYVNEKILRPIRNSYPTLFTDQTKYLINPAGLWTVGGPAADTGLSGRKIVVDNYGADCPIGGGSFSGKDPTKVDRSGAYAARHVAKNIVAAGLAKKATVQVSYAIGVVEPVSVRVQAVGSLIKNGSHEGYVSDAEASAVLSQMVMDTVDLSPSGIITRLKLVEPVYTSTASGGHFGRSRFTWEYRDLAHIFKGYVRERYS
jgi:S-adenosylmethionine synthetase